MSSLLKTALLVMYMFTCMCMGGVLTKGGEYYLLLPMLLPEDRLCTPLHGRPIKTFLASTSGKV